MGKKTINMTISVIYIKGYTIFVNYCLIIKNTVFVYYDMAQVMGTDHSSCLLNWVELKQVNWCPIFAPPIKWCICWTLSYQLRKINESNKRLQIQVTWKKGQAADKKKKLIKKKKKGQARALLNGGR